MRRAIAEAPHLMYDMYLRTRSEEELMRRCETLMKALKKELKDLEKKKAAAERKARTHRLVEIGAILEQATGLTFDTEDSRRALSTALNEQLYYSNGVAFTRGGDIASACGEPDGDQR